MRTDQAAPILQTSASVLESMQPMATGRVGSSRPAPSSTSDPIAIQRFVGSKGSTAATARRASSMMYSVWPVAGAASRPAAGMSSTIVTTAVVSSATAIRTRPASRQQVAAKTHRGDTRGIGGGRCMDHRSAAATGGRPWPASHAVMSAAFLSEREMLSSPSSRQVRRNGSI